MILGKYKITYSNGISQFKNLISHIDYLQDIRVVEDNIYELEKKNKFKETKESLELKRYLKDTYGEFWFTDESPLWSSRLNGIMKLPKSQGENHYVKLIKL